MSADLRRLFMVSNKDLELGLINSVMFSELLLSRNVSQITKCLCRLSGTVILIVYDILVSGSDIQGVDETKKYLRQYFVFKN